MDIGLHFPESNPGNENTSLSQRELGSTEYCKTMSFHQNMRSASEQMLSFSSSSDKPEAFDFTKFVGLDNNNNNNNNKTSFSPFLHQIPSSYCKNSGGGYGYGYGYGGLMNTSLTGVKGPFTLTQWAELEQQALIYKYITANVPVPSSLLLSIKKAFYPYGSLPPNSFGWGGFHLGFSGGNMDPEPGRCRRTDGKKWRCSRDAVPDQKYCERHINRGRHRSRKPVEGHSGHTLSTKIVKPPIAAVAAAQQQPNHLPTDSIPNRVGNSRGSSRYATTINIQQQQSKESPPIIQKQRNIEFGHISSDSLLNPSHKPLSSSSSSSYLDFTNNTRQQDLKSDWTQLSISTPHQHNHNNNNKLLLSPLRLSREFDDETTTTLEPTNWIPISWGNSNSLGGPLGEVLNSTTNSPTGVLQKSTFCSLSNSSSASSPVCGGGENKNNSDDQIGSSATGSSTLVCSSGPVSVERNGNHFHFAT